MAYSYPIWTNVEACIYKSSKSFGAKDTSSQSIVVGSSSMNSHDFIDIITTRRFYTHAQYGKVCVFKFSADGIILKEMIFEDNNGKAGKHLKTRTKLNSIKGLS